MRIGIDGRVASRHFPGIGRYCQNLIAALMERHDGHELFVLYDPLRNPGLSRLAAAERARAGPPRAHFVALPVAVRSASEQVALPALVARLRLDLFHATYYAIPPLLRGKLVVTLYDLIPQLYPAYWPNPLVRRTITAWSSMALHRASAVLTLSEATRLDLLRLHGQAAAARPIIVTSCGADARFLRMAERRHAGPEEAVPGLPASVARPFFLYVGINKPHKNLVRLVEAFEPVRHCGRRWESGHRRTLGLRAIPRQPMRCRLVV